MFTWHYVVVFVTLVVAAAFLSSWIRRDKGAAPSDGRHAALHDA